MDATEINRIHQLNLKMSRCLIQRGSIINSIARHCINDPFFLNSTEHLDLKSDEEGLVTEYNFLKTELSGGN